jgi:hypothetical protein
LRKTIFITTEWQEDADYTLKLLSGFAVDYKDRKAKETTAAFKTMRKTDYGSIKLVNAKQPNRLIELINEQGKIIMRLLDRDEIIFDYLKPGTYSLRIIDDANNNHKWDSGTFRYQRSFPEKVFPLGAPIIIKANWEHKIDLLKFEPEKQKPHIKKAKAN